MVRIHFRSIQINVNIYHAIRQQPPYSLPFVHFSFSTIRFFLLPLRSFHCRNFIQRRVQSLSAPHVFFHLNPHVLFLSIYFAMCYLDLNLLYRFFFRALLQFGLVARWKCFASKYFIAVLHKRTHTIGIGIGNNWTTEQKGYVFIVSDSWIHEFIATCQVAFSQLCKCVRFFIFLFAFTFST